jgi:hypothetical protein
MFWAFELSFDADILAFLAWPLFWLLFEKLEDFFQSSGHPRHRLIVLCESAPTNIKPG